MGSCSAGSVCTQPCGAASTSSEPHVLFTFLLVLLHAAVKMPFPKAKQNHALMKSLPLHSKLEEPPECEHAAGCAPHHASPERASTSAGLRRAVKPEAAVLGAWECTAQQGCRPPDRELAGLKALAFILCSQLLPQMSRLYCRDEFDGCRNSWKWEARARHWLQCRTLIF